MPRVNVPKNAPPSTPLLFRVAFARARPCYAYGCICLTPDERAYERRVFRLAHAWGRRTREEATHAA